MPKFGLAFQLGQDRGVDLLAQGILTNCPPDPTRAQQLSNFIKNYFIGVTSVMEPRLSQQHAGLQHDHNRK